MSMYLSFFKPGWQTDYERNAIRTIERIPNNSILHEIALAGSSDIDRIIGHMEGAAKLRRIFDSLEDASLRSLAIRQAGGTLCSGCEKAWWPEDGRTLPCARIGAVVGLILYNRARSKRPAPIPR